MSTKVDVDLSKFNRITPRSLPKGVCRSRNKFTAYIHINRKKVHLGMFDTPEDASEAVKAERERLAGQGYVRP